jgi:RNA polymerase sigma-70 factor, ECF subfamily
MCIYILFTKGDSKVESDDAKIISLCKRNIREGFDALYNKYYRYVYTLCYRSSFCREDAADLMQEVFIKVYRNMDSFKENSPLLPWIKKITVNTCINHRSRSQQDKASLDSDSFPPAALADCKTDIDPQKVSESAELLTSIEKAVSILPPYERTAVILRHFENKAYDEIATIMDCPIGTITTYIFRGRRLLREILKDEGIWEV